MDKAPTRTKAKRGMSTEGVQKRIRALVVDAGPLITQSASYLQQFAGEFYTTPGVYSEIKDPSARTQLALWAKELKVRHPKPEAIRKVQNFAKLTGDHSVLSVNDVHIIALAYELECEMNKGDWRLRKYPGEKLEYRNPHARVNVSSEIEDQKESPKENEDNSELGDAIKENYIDGSENSEHTDTSGTRTSAADASSNKKPRRRGGKKQRAKREAEMRKHEDDKHEDSKHDGESGQIVRKEQQEEDDFEQVTKKVDNISLFDKEEKLDEHYDEDEDDGEWITSENLHEELIKDKNEQIQENPSAKKSSIIKVALATGDFACQNVSLQIGLNLMNAMSGKQIKRVRNYMYRCHACFRLTPIPKSGQPKHFCPKCGGNTLLRCAVSVDNITGKVTPHLKAGFQWYRRGERYSIPSPLSKNQQKIAGNAGYQHNKQNRHKTLQNPLILREDQKEYQQAIKNANWQNRQNEKMLEEWVGGGSADNYVSPFGASQTMRHSDVRVGKGRFVNSSRGKRK